MESRVRFGFECSYFLTNNKWYSVFMQRQYARVVSAEVICCSLMYHSLNKDYIQPWIDWLLQDKNCLEKQLEQHLGKNKKSVSSDETSPRLTNLFSSWKGLSRTNVTNAVRGDERSVISELSVCYYALVRVSKIQNNFCMTVGIRALFIAF